MRPVRLYRRQGEDGYVLPLALAFLVLCAVLTSMVLNYVGTGDRISSTFQVQRTNLYGADGAIDAAIKYAQSDASVSLGSSTDPTCQGGTFFTMIGSDGSPITVKCTATAGSGGSGGITTAPNFSILTLAPYHHGPAPVGNGNSPPGCVNEFPNELGIVQVQNSKLLQVNGNVYVNSDVDADVWSGGCPQQTTAQHIQVANGEVLQRESLHDIDACPNLHDHVTDCNGANNNDYLPDPLSSSDALKLGDPGLPSTNPANPTDYLNWQPNISSPPAAGQITDASGNVITTQTCPAADTTTGYRLVKFAAGTYQDATLLNWFMGGGCPNAVFWFQPGNYYFDFTNSGSHEWTINDTTTRVVGGQPFVGPTQSPTFVSETWKPAIATSTGTPAFANPAAAEIIDNAPSNATIGNGQTASISLKAFASGLGTGIPADAQINSVRLRVAHGETDSTKLKNPTVTITPAGGSPCPAVTINMHAAVTEDPSPSYDVGPTGTNCLNNVSQINANTSLTYSVAHCTGTAGGCTTASTTDSVDGIWLDITYTSGGRVAWNPNDQSTITPSAPSLPGSCLSDRDSGKNWTDGVQFVFGGDSRMNLKSGKVELCDQRSDKKQEIVVSGVRATTPNTVGPTLWNAFAVANGANGFATSGAGIYTNAQTIDGSLATATINSSTARSVTLSNFSPTSWPIPAANQIPANATITGVTLSVKHQESSTSSSLGTPTYSILASGASGTCTGGALSKHTSLTTDSPTVTSCFPNPASLNGGVSISYSDNRASGSSTYTDSLDGMSLSVTYTVPGTTTGGLDPESGCVTQTPYYSPTDHSPAYNGACALLRVSSNAAGGSFPRILTLWGTVYAPSAALDVPVDVMTVPVFNRGVVARMLMLGYNVANNAIVPITTTPNAGFVQNNRVMTLAVQVPGKTTSVVALVKICDFQDSDCPTYGPGTGANPDPPVKVLSWAVTR